MVASPATGAAFTQLGDLLRDGKITVGDGARAAEYYRRVAEAGEPSGLQAVIPPERLYGANDAAPADGAAAIEAYRDASSFGYSEALIRLGDLYYDGTVVTKDLVKAIGYFREAAAVGSGSGKVRLGEMLARGQGAPRDVDGGRALVREVAEAGNTYAFVSLGDLYSRGDAGPIDPAVAIAAF